MVRYNASWVMATLDHTLDKITTSVPGGNETHRTILDEL